MTIRRIIPSIVVAALLSASVTTSAISAPPAEAAEKIKALANNQISAACESCKTSVELKWMAPAVANAPAEDITGLQFDEPGLPAGYVTGRVELQNSAGSANSTVQLHITVRKKLPVALRQIAKGESVGQEDITWQWKDISRFNREPLATLEAFSNKRTMRLIRKGYPFFSGDLSGPDTITPGDPVVMEYGEEGVRIQINCTAREAKGPGEKIRLYSKETRKNYIAEIVNKNKIIWVRTL